MRRNAEAAVAELEQSTQQLEARIDAAERTLGRSRGDAAAQAERDAAVAQLITIESRAEQIAVDAALYGSGWSCSSRRRSPKAPRSLVPCPVEALHMFVRCRW